MQNRFIWFSKGKWSIKLATETKKNDFFRKKFSTFLTLPSGCLGQPISQPPGKNYRIALVAPLSVQSRAFMPNFIHLGPVEFSIWFLGSNFWLRIFKTEDICSAYRQNRIIKWGGTKIAGSPLFSPSFWSILVNLDIIGNLMGVEFGSP